MNKRVLIIALVPMLLGLNACGSPPVASTAPSDSPQAVSTASSEGTSSGHVSKITFHSELLKKDMAFSIYLPAGYGGARYPTLYMIHGYSGNENGWFGDLDLDGAADTLIREKEIVPLIIVTPQMDNSYGLDSSETPIEYGTPPARSLNEGMYESYLCNELIPYVDSHYNTAAERESRYIGGLSMGGFISLHTAFLHTDLFSKVGGHSPAVILDDTPDVPFAWVYPDEAARARRDPIYLAQSRDISMLKVYLDCGQDDYYRFYEGCRALSDQLEAHNVSYEYHLNKGKHDGDYWRSNAPGYLLFYAGKE